MPVLSQIDADTPPVTLVTRTELIPYFIIWCVSLGYSCYAVFQTSQEYKDYMNPNLFEPGWSFLNREKDIGDFEWTFFYKWSWVVLPWYLAYIVFGQLCQWKLYQYRSVFSLGFSVTSLCCVMGWKPVLLTVGHCTLSYLSSLMQSSLLVWAVSLLLLSTLNFQPFLSWMKGMGENDPLEHRFYLVLFTLALSNLRYTSFSLEKVRHSHEHCQREESCENNTGPANNHRLQNQEKTQEKSYSFKGAFCYRLMDLLLYNFYIPLFYTGPILTYDVFAKQMFRPKPPWNVSRILALTKQFTRVIFWAVINELLLHYFYFHSLNTDQKLLSKVPLWSLAGTGYLTGQFFMMKYVVMFGFPACIARVDGFSPPEGPKCISRVYNYSDMWKYFDRGLYSFIKRYIYVPLGGSRSGVRRQLWASALTFVFVFYWHGAEYYLFLWTVFNFAGIAIETLGHHIVQMPTVVEFESQFFSPSMISRLHALCTVPLFAASTLSIFVFFGGTDGGFIYFQRLIIEGFPVSCGLIVLVLYCGVHVCSAIDQWELQKIRVKTQ